MTDRELMQMALDTFNDLHNNVSGYTALWKGAFDREIALLERRLAQAEPKRRFCTSCQAHRDEATGVMRVFRNTKRWVCLACIERRSGSIYKNYEKDNDRLQRL